MHNEHKAFRSSFDFTESVVALCFESAVLSRPAGYDKNEIFSHKQR